MAGPEILTGVSVKWLAPGRYRGCVWRKKSLCATEWLYVGPEKPTRAEALDDARAAKRWLDAAKQEGKGMAEPLTPERRAKLRETALRVLAGDDLPCMEVEAKELLDAAERASGEGKP